MSPTCQGSLSGTPIGFAHRGARAHARENTLEAFALALEMGARGLESDLWPTADGEVVLDHDGDVGGVPIPSLSRTALPSHIPSLEDLYRECGTDFELSLDVKDVAAAPELLRVAGAAHSLGKLWLCHWNWKQLVPWREACGEVRLVDSTSLGHMKTAGPPRAERMQALGIDALNLHHSQWSWELREALAEKGRLAFAWDLQESAELQAALELGVDAVYSDHVDRMCDALREHVGGPA